MAEAGLVDHDQYSCSVCLDFLRDPVTIPCGHSYCLSCINECWNQEQSQGYKCPQCRQTFSSKPPLNRNILLSEIMENMREKVSPQTLAGPGDIPCDFCAGEGIKAVKSCLECRASYCEIHVQAHYNVPALRKHNLVKAATIPTCSKHDKLLEVYCRTDQTCVCMHCLMDDHKGHDTVASSLERNEKQKKLLDNQTKLKKTIQVKEKELQKMTTDISRHSDAAEKIINASTKAFKEIVKQIEKKSFEMMELIKAQEYANVDEGKKQQEKLKKEIAELNKNDKALESLMHTEDNIHFLQNYESVSSSTGPYDSPSLSVQLCSSFEDLYELVCELFKRLENTCNKEFNNTISKVSDLATKAPKSEINVGDNVRVKPSVLTPKHKWGSVTHKSVGVVKNIQGELLTVDFPEQKNWTGVASEMESLTDAASDLFSLNMSVIIKIGDKVRVKPCVNTPKHNWGKNVTHKSVGVVKAIKADGSLIVDFPGYKNWKGILSEMEPVTNDDDIGSSSQDPVIKVGEKVRVKPSVLTPTHKWGSVSHKSIGVVQKVHAESLTVDFPEQKNWTGVISEMEIVVSDLGSVGLKVGDRVRVKPSVSKPSQNWGSVTRMSVGVIKEIKPDESLIVNFPEQPNWKGTLSEMERVSNEFVESTFNVGDKVRVKPSVVTPAHKWGSVSHKSIGVVQKIQGDSLIVDFSEHKKWTGKVSEMELVTSSDADIS